MGPLFRSKLVREFLDAVLTLPTVAPRTVVFDSARTRYWTAAEHAALPEAERAPLLSRSLGESFYYNTRYGTPLAYARALYSEPGDQGMIRGARTSGRLVHLCVGDSAFVAAPHGLLKPGGLALIYNISPAPAAPGRPYVPWADGRCPFPRAQLESAGFEILAFDRDDSAFVRHMGHALGWDDPAGAKMDLENDLFAHYTLLRRARSR